MRGDDPMTELLRDGDPSPRASAPRDAHPLPLWPPCIVRRSQARGFPASFRDALLPGMHRTALHTARGDGLR